MMCRGCSEDPGWKLGAGVLGPHLRVRAAIVLPNVGWPQFLNQDSDDADKQDEVHLLNERPPMLVI